ncbi:MAG: hypothetical protein IT353_19310 [Gemmatimonadaceae bacterium]|nr:hypothetical protein [Gemmatimonadaceae bacterium]
MNAYLTRRDVRILVCASLMGILGCGAPSDRSARSMSEWLSGLTLPSSATVKEFVDSFQKPNGGLEDQGLIVVRWEIDGRDMPPLMAQARRKGFRDISSSPEDSMYLAGKVNAARYVYTLKRGSSVEDWQFVVLDSAAGTMHVSVSQTTGH